MTTVLATVSVQGIVTAKGRVIAVRMPDHLGRDEVRSGEMNYIAFSSVITTGNLE